jgi:transposase-like protein
MRPDEQMVNLGRKLDGAIKAKIVVESLKGEKTIPELGSSYGVHPKMIQLWKRRALEGLPKVAPNVKTEKPLLK